MSLLFLRERSISSSLVDAGGVFTVGASVLFGGDFRRASSASRFWMDVSTRLIAYRVSKIEDGEAWMRWLSRRNVMCWEPESAR